MAISFFFHLGVILHKGGDRNTRGRRFRVKKRSDRENWACLFGKLGVENDLKNHALTLGQHGSPPLAQFSYKNNFQSLFITNIF